MSDIQDNLVPIRTVCAMFSINANTLRAWERRYGIISPTRGDGGQRGYDVDNLNVIRDMLELIRNGMTASEAASQILSRRESTRGTRHYETWKARFQKATESLQVASIVQVCRKAESAIGYQATVESVLFPALFELGERWHDNLGTIAEEHNVTLGIRTYLSERFISVGIIKRSVPIVTLACAPGELHDLPVLHLANLLISTGQVRPIVLAGGLPLRETISFAERSESRLLLLSATMPLASALIREWVTELSKTQWESKSILAGGPFMNSRIFSETGVRAAAGSYEQSATLIMDLLNT